MVGVGNDLAGPNVWKGVINMWDILIPEDKAKIIFHLKKKFSKDILFKGNIIQRKYYLKEGLLRS